MGFFKTALKAKIEIPDDFTCPFSVRLQENKVMLLWAANESEKSMWVQAFRDCRIIHNQNVQGMRPGCDEAQDEEEEKVPALLLKDDNEFIVTLLKCLVPARDKQGKTIAQNIDFRIRIH